ncbi:LOB domain-containing protein 18-like [Cucurbita moschata]|uniref:LOB domain-containing protein 18-like n=1 Tax=Cucurbita moschata TaxID=3662 RepID=A0A6J1EC58_CUCMO|nr:LOB domain-containing protein 18-like [Cucurbita moschata]
MSSRHGGGGCKEGNGGSSSNGSGGPCGACKFLRRKCTPECIFAPYFDSEQGTTHFAAVHKVFGASNVSKLLLHIPEHKRLDAAITICYEAQARVREPVFGCVAHIFALQQQAARLQVELSYLQAYLAASELSRTAPHPQAQPQDLVKPTIPSIVNLPLDCPSLPSAASDLSLLLDPVEQASPAKLQSPLEFCQIRSNNFPSMGSIDQQIVQKQLSTMQRIGASLFPYVPKRA